MVYYYSIIGVLLPHLPYEILLPQSYLFSHLALFYHRLRDGRSNQLDLISSYSLQPLRLNHYLVAIQHDSLYRHQNQCTLLDLISN